jgi:hypothetical protein
LLVPFESGCLHGSSRSLTRFERGTSNPRCTRLPLVRFLIGRW